MTATVAGIHGGLDTHANRPAGNAVPDGSLYSCSTHGLIYKSNLAGNSWATYATLGSGSSVATDAIWTTAGKVAVATGSATATEQWPPGHEFDYVQITSPVSVTATTEGTANTCITSSSVTYDGSTVVLIEVYTPYLLTDTTSGRDITVILTDSVAGVLGNLAYHVNRVSGTQYWALFAARRLTPSAAAHVYTVKAYVSAGTGSFGGGAGGTGAQVPAFIRITKV